MSPPGGTGATLDDVDLRDGSGPRRADDADGARTQEPAGRDAEDAVERESRATQAPEEEGAKAAARRFKFDGLPADPETLFKMSTAEVEAALNAKGYSTTVRISRSKRAEIVEIRDHPELTMIEVHGGGRHQGPYVRISTNTEGKIWIGDSRRFKLRREKWWPEFEI